MSVEMMEVCGAGSPAVYQVAGSVATVASMVRPRIDLLVRALQSSATHTFVPISEKRRKIKQFLSERRTDSMDVTAIHAVSRARETTLQRLSKGVSQSPVKRLTGSPMKAELFGHHSSSSGRMQRPDMHIYQVRRSSASSSFSSEERHCAQALRVHKVPVPSPSQPSSDRALIFPNFPASEDPLVDCCDWESFVGSVGNVGTIPSVQHQHKTDLSLSSLKSTKFLPGFIDTHCHLDMLFQRIKHSGRLSDYLQKVAATDAFPASYEGCVTIFCKPWMFGKVYLYETLISEANIWAGFGCHPHFADRYSAVEEGHLRVALRHPKTVALGEVGLDYSNRDTNKVVQQRVLRRQLTIAVEMKKPLVIHCRDAHQDCLAILKELVPQETPIHRHCFTDGWREAVEWLSSFPNLYLGFTNLAGFTNSPRSAPIRDVIARVPLDRILLETDAPYFRPRVLSGSGQHANPGMAIHVAAEIAKIRNEDIQVILSHARRNTKAVYGV